MPEWIEFNRKQDGRPVVFNMDHIRNVEDCNPPVNDACDLIFDNASRYTVAHGYGEVQAALQPKRVGP